MNQAGNKVSGPDHGRIIKCTFGGRSDQTRPDKPNTIINQYGGKGIRKNVHWFSFGQSSLEE